MGKFLSEKFTPKNLGVYRAVRKITWFHQDLRVLLNGSAGMAPLMLAKWREIGYPRSANCRHLGITMHSIWIPLFIWLLLLPCIAQSQEIKPVQNEVSPTYQPVKIVEQEATSRQRDLGFMRPGGNEGGPGYFLQYQPMADVAGQETELGFIRQQLRFGAPIYRDEINTIILNGAVQNHLFQGSAVFPDSGQAFPESLWNIRLSTMYLRKLEDGWMLGMMGGVTIASDEPFTQSRDVNANVMAFLRVPQSDT